PRRHALAPARLPHQRCRLRRLHPRRRVCGPLHGAAGVKVRDVAAALERLAPLGWAYSWDRPGLRIGDPEAKVTRVLVALTATREVFNRARDARAELVVLHHPPLWRPLETLRTDDPDTRLFLDFAQAGIACYASHTNLDVAPGGLNHLLAAKLGLTGLQPLIPAEHAA